MNIIIVSFHFHPELSPRAFRAYELVRELCRQGHEVKLILPDKEVFHGNAFSTANLQTVYIGHKIIAPQDNDAVNAQYSRKRSFLKRILFPSAIRPLLLPTIQRFKRIKRNYFPPFFQKDFARAVAQELWNEKVSHAMVISVGLPIEVHIGTAMGLLGNKRLRKEAVTVADYGDPYYFNEGRNIFFLYFFIDYFIGRIFQYIVVPDKKAVQSYLQFKRRDRIKVIPQGINIADYKIRQYKSKGVTSFAYAGVFYKKTRDPGYFLEYISRLPFCFRFTVFTINAYDTLAILKKYERSLGDRLEIKVGLSRHDVISELSKNDFLINFENATSNQVPSKLIDYAIAGRPVCSISTSEFNPEVFNQFVKRDYSNASSIKLENFDIRKIASSFCELNKT